MYSSFSSYKVEIKNIKFINDKGIRYPKTAVIQFEIPGREKPLIEIMGYKDPEEIYSDIDNHQDIILDNCYINRLSLNDYRHTRKLEDKSYIEIKNFSARNSFFDTDMLTDLSFGNFTGNHFILADSYLNKGAISFNSSHFGNLPVNLSNLKTGDGFFDFSNVKIGAGEVNFNNSIFGEGKKDFQYTDFGTGKKKFENLDFGEGDISFINTHFNEGNVLFKMTRFGKGKTDFHYAKFGMGDISFERADFGDGEINFRAVEFSQGKVNFNRSIFGSGNIYFDGSELKEGKISFKRTDFMEGNLSFELAEMINAELTLDKASFGKGTISFYQAKIGTLSLNSCHLDYYTDLRLSECNYLDLSNTVVRDILDIASYDFQQNIKIINFSGMLLIGRINIHWVNNNVYGIISNQQDTNDRLKAEQFRTLKENFKNCGLYSYEDNAYIWFKRFEAVADLKDYLLKSKWNALWLYPYHFFKYLIFDKAGHFGTNPARVILTMMVTYFSFSFLFFFLIVLKLGNITESVDHTVKLPILGQALYHSAITFFTIGYGDYYPSGWIQVFSGIEGFVGVFLMSYFTVAFVRKILR